jgi:hypothetical protein
VRLDQRERLLGELIFFMDTTENEQRRRLGEDLPTLDEYARCRMGTSAVSVVSAFNE